MATTTQTQTQTTHGAPSGPVTAALQFFVAPADGSAPYNYVDPAPGQAQNNFSMAGKPVAISDMRGQESSFNLDQHAFATVKHDALPGVDFGSDASIRATYYPEVEAVLRRHVPGAQRVILFDHTVRRQGPAARRAPVTRVHIDQTAASAAERVRLHVAGEAEAQAALKGRYRIINVWRPLNGTVESFPLAVADSGTVPDKALVPVEHRYPDRTGETAGVKFDKGMRWWYLSGMRNDERLLLQCFDSLSGSRVPHTAFADPRSTEESKPRESIEVRALVLG